MKQIKLASAIAFAMGIAAAGSASATDGGTISFTGSVTNQTCTITPGGDVRGSDGSNFTVVMSEATTAELNAAGQTSAQTFPFSLSFSPGEGGTPCAAGTVATISFVSGGGTVDTTTGTLKNTTTGAGYAANANIQLLSGTGAGTVINLANANSTSVTLGVGGLGQLNYQARYFATGVATPGLVQSNIAYTATYN
jgi:major type 1 subunit fimbrin (pilin)